MKQEKRSNSKPTLRKMAFAIAQQHAELLMRADPKLSKAQAITKFLETENGQACYEVYRLGIERGDPSDVDPEEPE